MTIKAIALACAATVLSTAAVSQELFARKEEVGKLLAREEGKTLAEATAEVARAAQSLDFFAGETMRLSGELLASTRPGVP